jgi:uncharacterized protein (UPF0261 family)
MARSPQSPGVIRGSFAVYDVQSNPVTGLDNSDFEKLAALDGVDASTDLAVTEVGDGRYTYTFTATAGYWCINIRQSTNAPRGFQDEYDVN